MMKLFVEFVKSGIRYLLAALFGALVLRNVVSAELAASILDSWPMTIATWIVTFAFPLAWMWLKNQKWIQTIVTALRMPAGTSTEVLEATVKADGPKIVTVVP
jgi:hypothetical protein